MARAIGHQRARRPQRHFARARRPPLEERVQQHRAARIGQQLAAQANQPARRNLEFHAHSARSVIHHLGHFPAPRAQRFHDDAQKVLRHVNHQHFQRLMLRAIDFLEHDFRLAHHQFVAFAPHRFNQDRELQFAAAQDAKTFRRVRIFHADAHIGQQFALQTVANITRGHPLPFAPGQRRGIHREHHGQCRLVNGQRLERRRPLDFCDRLADLNAFNAGNGDDLSRGHLLRFHAFQPLEGKQFRNSRGGQRPVALGNPRFRIAAQRAIEHATDRDATQKVAVIQIRNLNLQRRCGIARRRGNMLHNRFEQRTQILRPITHLCVRHAGLRVGVEHREIELVFCRIQIDKQVIDFVQHGFRARIGAINLIQHDDRRELSLQRFLQHVARLRQRPFAGIHQQNHAIHHA